MRSFCEQDDDGEVTDGLRAFLKKQTKIEMSSERSIDDVIFHALNDADQRKCLWHTQNKKMKCFVNIREAEFSELLFPNNMSLRDDFVAHLVAYFKPLMKCEKGRQQVLRSHTLESPFFEKGKNRYVPIPAVEYTGRLKKA